MPRLRRRTIPDVTYHLISRFVDREWFISNERERSTYLKFLGEALATSSWRCLGYAVMSNHIHLAMVASDEPLADWIRHPHSAFADWMNRTHKRIGNIFTRGPKSILIPDSRVGHLLAYIHNNPVRAKLVATPGQSTWTSHRFYANASEPAPKWLRVDEGVRRAGLGVGETFDDFVRATTAHPILGHTDSHEQFLEKLEAYEAAQAALMDRPSPQRVSPALLVHLAADESRLTVDQLCSKRRGITEQHARAAVIVCGVQLGLTQSELALALCISPQAVSKTLSREQPVEVERLATRVLERLRGADEHMLMTA